MAQAANLPDADDPRRSDDDIDGHVVLCQLPLGHVAHHLAAAHGPEPPWSRARLEAIVTGATIAEFAHASDERSLCKHASPSDKLEAICLFCVGCGYLLGVASQEVHAQHM